MIDKIQEIALAVVMVVMMMAPYLLLGFAIAGLLSLFFTPARVTRHLGRRGLWQVVKAALMGVPLPLCSCGVLPLALSLRKEGAGKGATASFLASTPQTGVDSILLTYSLLGPVIALLRVVAAFVSGIVAGLLTDWVCRKEEPSSKDDALGLEKSCCCSEDPRANDEASSSQGTPAWRSRAAWQRALRQGFVVLPRDMARPLLLGVLVAGLVTALVPEGLLAAYIPPGPLGYLLALLIGIPMYVCSASSVPIAALLIQAGVSPGAAMVFLIAGPATNSAAVFALWHELGHRGTLAYLGAICAVALVSGFCLDALLAVVVASVPILHQHGGVEGGLGVLWQWGAALLLVVLLVPGLFKARAEKSNELEV